MPLCFDHMANFPTTAGTSSCNFCSSIISRPLHPLIAPCFMVCSSCFLSSGVFPTRTLPHRLNGKSSSSASCPMILFPSAQHLAFRLPTGLANPPCTTAELRPLVSLQTSRFFSSTAIFNRYRDNSLAIALPTTPAPIITTSYCFCIISPSF